MTCSPRRDEAAVVLQRTSDATLQFERPRPRMRTTARMTRMLLLAAQAATAAMLLINQITGKVNLAARRRRACIDTDVLARIDVHASRKAVTVNSFP